MRKRINLLALLVVAAGGAAAGRPAALGATYFDPLSQFRSCCDARNGFGNVVMRCCSYGGCAITRNGCFPLQ